MQLSLSDKRVDVWVVDLQVPERTLERAYDILSEDEQKRAHRFHFPADSRRFVIARATMRKILGNYLRTPPELLEFEYNAHGKPSLSKLPTDIRFNASRSGERALVACTMGHDVGVDIESVQPEIDIDELSRQFFTVAENEKLRTFPPDQQHQVFLRCWTCKEAYLKGIGKGLSLDLDSFDVSLSLGDPTPHLSTPIERFAINGWSLIPFATTNTGYISALAVEGEDAGVTVQLWAELER